MAPPLPFAFGIALTPRANAVNWPLVQALLDLTLSSVLAQTAGDFRVLIFGHDRPRLPDDPRVAFTTVDWAVEPPGPHNDDSGRKKHAINDQVLQQGGGLLMLLDADDWVDRRLVETAREMISAETVGAILAAGYAVDLKSLRTCPLPHPQVFEGEFHRLCGSSTVAHLRPGHPDPLRRDPFSVLRSHHQWLEVARAQGVALARLPAPAAYLVNTSENHSDLHGPHAVWRAQFFAALNRHGESVDQAFADHFGQRMDAIKAASALARPGPEESTVREDAVRLQSPA